MWKADSLRSDVPLYAAIADRIAADIESGRLAPGTRLPAQRALAAALGVNFTTVTRGYAEAERRGLVAGEVGRGTFVRVGRGVAGGLRGSDPGRVVDVGVNLPPALAADAAARALEGTHAQMAKDVAHRGLLDYQANAGTPDHRAAGANWITGHQPDVAADPDCVVICSGAQHAITALLMSLTSPGDVVATESLTYPGLRSLAAQMHLQLLGLPADDEGLLVEPFRAACRRGGVAVLYCTPTLHNPTTSTMSVARRQEIASVAADAGVPIIEDDVYGPLLRARPPCIASLAREHTYYVASLSKAVAPGLRIAYVLSPDRRAAERLASAVRATTWMAAPLLCEIASRWIADGTANRILQVARRDLAARQRRARALLGGWDLRAAPTGMHAWLQLPRPWTTADFVLAAQISGVRVAPADAFAVGDAPAAVRLSVGGPAKMDDLEQALAVVAQLLASPPGFEARL
ncbi:PLP-dependent aminotransferase family protein [Longimicrobium sp.]|uniref:aminotransferase-like domain-containing protein n=1 Tax=Longimicrobium sp. TaxID=2029185 RepID=UPI002F91FA3B